MAVLSTELLADNLDVADAAGERARAAAGRRIQETKRAEFHSLELVLDAGLAGSPIVAEGAGTRLPHLWLGANRSLYDALGPGYTLLVLGGEGPAPGSLPMPLDTLDLRDRGLRERFGADLVLVRPDQHVAWRGERIPAGLAELVCARRASDPEAAGQPL